MFPEKISGMSLHNPVTSAVEKYTSSLDASYKLIGTFTDERESSTTDHILAVK